MKLPKSPNLEAQPCQGTEKRSDKATNDEKIQGHIIDIPNKEELLQMNRLGTVVFPESISVSLIPFQLHRPLADQTRYLCKQCRF